MRRARRRTSHGRAEQVAARVFTAADLIDVMAARARRRHPLQLDRPFGEFPPTWRAWFQAITPNPEGVHGAHPDAMAAVMAARPLRPRPRRTPVLTRWVAFRQLWRQQWDAAEPTQRRLRRGAAATSFVLHIGFMPEFLTEDNWKRDVDSTDQWPVGFSRDDDGAFCDILSRMLRPNQSVQRLGSAR